MSDPSAPQWILQRRSIREYTSTPITDEQFDALIQAAMAAPSANEVSDVLTSCGARLRFR